MEIITAILDIIQIFLDKEASMEVRQEGSNYPLLEDRTVMEGRGKNPIKRKEAGSLDRQQRHLRLSLANLKARMT